MERPLMPFMGNENAEGVKQFLRDLRDCIFAWELYADQEHARAERLMGELADAVSVSGHCVCKFNGKGDVLEICSYHGRFETVIQNFKDAFPSEELYKHPWLRSEIEGGHDGNRKLLWDKRMKYELRYTEAKLHALESQLKQAKETVRAFLEIGKRNLENPKYDSFFNSLATLSDNAELKGETE